MGRKPIVSVTFDSERISIKKKQLTLLKMCVTSLLCRPSYGRYRGFYVKGFLRINRLHKTAINRPVDHTGET